jgi:hypothetical protein
VPAGAGHAHALVLRAVGARAAARGGGGGGVAAAARAAYSGMVPGWLAGPVPLRQDIVVDFAALCARAGARWVAGEVQAVEGSARAPRRTADGARAGVGRAVAERRLRRCAGGALGHARVLALRPLAALRPAWEAELARRWQAGAAPARAAGDGGGRRRGGRGGAAGGGGARCAPAARSVRWRRGRSAAAPVLPADLREPARRADAPGPRSGPAWRCMLDTPLEPGAWTRTAEASPIWAAGAQAHDWQLDHRAAAAAWR